MTLKIKIRLSPKSWKLEIDLYYDFKDSLKPNLRGWAISVKYSRIFKSSLDIYYLLG